MPAGTISLTNNSTAVAGAGTDFESELNANDFIVITVGGETYTLGVAAVASGTALTLIRPFSGPTTSGIAWGVVPANTMVRIAAELAEQTTFALRANNIAKINWNAVFSESGDITVTLLDGTTFNGPSWKKIVDLLNELDIDAVQQLADQVRADAQQVATDKQAASDSASAAEASRQAALTSSTNANNKAAAAAASATTAGDSNTAAQQAKADAIAAKEAAQQAAANVPSMDNIDAHLKSIGLSGVLVNITDLNNIVLTGAEVVHFSFLNTATGSPGEAGLGTQWVNGVNLVQLVTSSAGNQFRRVKAGTAAWGDWSKVGFNNNDLTSDPWKNLTLSSGWTVVSDATNPRRAAYRKVMGRVYIDISGIVPSSTISAGAVIATLPVGYRPSAINYSMGSINVGGYSFYVTLTGSLCMSNGASSGSSVTLSLSYEAA